MADSGDFVEGFAAGKARSAVRDLTALAPQTAVVLRNGNEIEVPIGDVNSGETVIARPGESIPVDGIVLSGNGSVNQSAISGESMPVEAQGGSRVFAASTLLNGMLNIQVTAVGAESTFGRVIRMVEDAEANRADVQRAADRFAGYYLPVVTGIALLTYFLRGDPLATAAVLVVACSCSFALATPIAMLASIGSGARQGLLIKGGKHIEMLDKVDTLFVDKTGTLTLGKPVVTDVIPLADFTENDVIQFAASAERYSEHPLAKAVLNLAAARNIQLLDSTDFKNTPGVGVRSNIGKNRVDITNKISRMPERLSAKTKNLMVEGKSVFFLRINNTNAAIFAASDEPRHEVKEAIRRLKTNGYERIILISGDREPVVRNLARELEIDYHAELLPEEKVHMVHNAQSRGETVAMVGDGINDAPALAQAEVGIAMGETGSQIAIEAAHVSLLREDWTLVPKLFEISRRTMRVVRLNILFTAIYNLAGLSLAALGILPPMLAAAAQSLPDLGILANSARLIRSK